VKVEREIQKVTDPSRIVADEHLLRELERWGIDKDYVEFFQDYSPRSKGKEHSPYAKFYRDLKSGKRFMVASGLPMVKALGRKIEAGWLYANGKYYSKANLFSAIVEGNRVQVTCLSDQPDGRKLNDRVIWQPQLFLNGVEQSFGKATLLETDPTNENYHQNVLEWDYGICQRRLRIIEGRVRERWVFAGNPHGEVRIKHNQVGDYRLKLGRFKVNDDEELILAEAFILPNYFFTEYPIEIGASATFYPDADPETSSFDGMCYPWEEVCIDITWAIVRDYFVSEYGDAVDDTDYLAIQIQTCVQTDRFKAIIRSPCLFDISPLPPGATLDSGTFSLYGYAKNDDLNINPSINIFESNPQSNTAIAITDYALARWGSTPFSTAIALSLIHI